MEHTALMVLTAHLPMKTIEVDGEPYLERYHVCNEPDGTQHWLHRLLRNDSERHLHSHPWDATSLILCGWYIEELANSSGDSVKLKYSAGHRNHISKSTVHRIVEVLPNTWTSITVKPGRSPSWYFIDEEGNKKIMETSPVDWWVNCESRTKQIQRMSF